MALRSAWTAVAAPPAVSALTMGLAWALTSGMLVGPGFSRPALVTALVGLATIAVAVALFGAMGLRRESAAVRLVILVPLALSVLLIAVLMLDTHARRAGLVDLADQSSDLGRQ